MKTNQQEIDKLIKESLSKEEAEFYDSLEEQSLLEMMGGLFKGRMRWILILLSLVQVVAFAFGIYCAVEFFGTEDANLKLTWGIGFLTMMIMTSFIKSYSWMHINNQTILRELKRIEYQISILSSKGL